MSQLSFTERMAGHLSLQSAASFPWPMNEAKYLENEKSKERFEFEFTLTIQIDDLDCFIQDPNLKAKVFGSVSGGFFGQAVPVKDGVFNLFVKPAFGANLNDAKEMHYQFQFSIPDGRSFTLFGYKEILKEDGVDLWSQTTTLYVAIANGIDFDLQAHSQKLIAIGVLHISPGDFMHQLTTFKSSETTEVQKLLALEKFVSVFAKNVWAAMAPFLFTTTRLRWNEHFYPVNTLQGVTSGEKATHFLDTADGLTLQLHQFSTGESQDVVLLLHGLTTSTDMFIMPEHQNLVNELHRNGYQQVWSLDWRGSGRLTYNLNINGYTMDHVALYDIPAALEFIRAKMGESVRIHVIAHCVGSLSLMCSIAAGKAKGIASVISNSVSLTPRVRWQSRLKGMFGPFILQHIFGYPYVSPRMPYMPGFRFGKWIYWMERSIRCECKEPACHMVSFMWGWGFPAAFEHKNLHPITHRRLVDLFGGVSFEYYRHVNKMVAHGEALPFNHLKENFDLPASYLQNIKNVELPPMILISGDNNLIFPNSNKTSFEKMKELVPSAKVNYWEIPGYGHQDVFMGKNVHIDVFPKFFEFMDQFSQVKKTGG